MGGKCVPLLTDSFLYSYQNEFLDKLIEDGNRKLAKKISFTYSNIDGLSFFNNKRIQDFISESLSQGSHHFLYHRVNVNFHSCFLSRLAFY